MKKCFYVFMIYKLVSSWGPETFGFPNLGNALYPPTFNNTLYDFSFYKET